MLTFAAATLRAKAGLGDDDSHDAALAALAAEQTPVLEASLTTTEPPEVALGIAEIVAAEFLDQMARGLGECRIGELSAGAPSSAELRARGEARLAPYRRDLRAVRAAGPR